MIIEVHFQHERKQLVRHFFQQGGEKKKTM